MFKPAPSPNTARPPDAAPQTRWDLFCRVVDNHGDLGVCWRLAVNLARRGLQVRLWVDDASALSWMAPDGEPGVQLLPWRDPLGSETPGDVVVETFGCNPPAAFLARMATAPVPPVWINLEYLSAQAYVERSHGLCSPQWSGPAAGLKKWFFYPGLTPRTGGLIRELDLEVGPRTHDLTQDQTQERHKHHTRIFLFGYQQPALPGLLDACSLLPAGHSATVSVTPGWSSAEIALWLGKPLPAGDSCQRGSLQLVGLPYMSQTQFDRHLANSDLNLVRGEDSLVRALWAGRPLLWQLYPQDDGAHLDKLQAFLNLYLDAGSPALLRAAFEAWNGARPWCAQDWTQVLLSLAHQPHTDESAAWASWSGQRARDLAHQQDDLVTTLIDFAFAKAASERL